MKCSVIVPTYNSPRELDLALCGLARQTRPPEEILIADDGSTDETRAVIESWRNGLNTRVVHVWHSDLGYRKARIVNEAVRRASGDHLIFIDGDSIPHRHWVADHMKAADGRRVLCGRRVKLGPRLSAVVTREQVLTGRIESLTGPLLRSYLSGDTKRLMLGVRLPSGLARCFHPRPRKLMGVNFSLPRDVFEQVNGYDEEWKVYGHEDRDLELRLLRAGIPFYPLLNRAVVYHLYHPFRPISQETRDLIAQQEASSRTRCRWGLAQSLDSDPFELDPGLDRR